MSNISTWTSVSNFQGSDTLFTTSVILGNILNISVLNILIYKMATVIVYLFYRLYGNQIN